MNRRCAAWRCKEFNMLLYYGIHIVLGPSEITPSVPVAAARHWYNRVKNYAWDKPSISTKSTQFTQLVWSASQQVKFSLLFYNLELSYTKQCCTMS